MTKQRNRQESQHQEAPDIRSGIRIEAWLSSGGYVLASSLRAARALANAYHQTRRNQGLLAWPTPPIFDWESWLSDTWRTTDSSVATMLLSPLQERSLWSRVIRKRPVVEGLTRVDRLAASAQRAYQLLATHAPAMLQARARMNWTGDAEIFSQWLADFDTLCKRDALLSPARLPQLLTESLIASPPGQRPPLLLVGFDRILPSQQSLLDAWGAWQQDAEENTASTTHFYATQDNTEELEACLRWLYAQRRTDPDARLMVVATGLSARRGELERAFLNPQLASHENSLLNFEFSLGVPLLQTGIVRSALLLLRWLYEPLEESELDWLLLSGHGAATEDEWLALAQTMLALRENGREQPLWTIAEFTLPDLPDLAPPSAWSARLESARQLYLAAPRRQSPLDWAGFTSRLLETLHWPGFQPESSAAYQARDRWETLLESCAALGFDGSEIEWAAFVGSLAQAASETIFAIESSNAQVQITEPLTSAGQTADAIWFLGAHEEGWPGRGQPHPLIPLAVQRETGMPHSSHLVDWELAHSATTRILHAADKVVFSYAHHAADVEQRPSRLITQLAGAPTAIPASLRSGSEAYPVPLTEIFEDTSQIPFTQLSNFRRATVGGAETLTAQSLCPFQSFANKRLNAPAFDPAETGLNARQRGQLLHAVLHHIWSSPSRGGITTHADLLAIPDLESFVRTIVGVVMRESFQPSRRTSLPSRFPARILDLESERLARLVTEWLAYERTRLPFTVAATERKAEVTIAGLRLNLRLDRVDHVSIDNGQDYEQAALVIDYKSSAVGPTVWRGDRPDDVQLPLYATYALRQPIEGLLIAQVRSGETNLCGRAAHATQSLFANLTQRNSLVSDPLTEEQLDAWRLLIERLATDFLSGIATVTPKDPAKTCAACGLHSICRIHDNQPLTTLITEADDTADDSESTNA